MTFIVLLILYTTVTLVLSAWERQAYRRTTAGLPLADKAQLFDTNLSNGWAIRVSGLLPVVILLPLIPLFFDVLRPYRVGCFAASMVEKDGSTSQVQLVSATDDGIGQAACEAVMHWRFTPPMKDGVHVRVARQVPFAFHSNSHEAGPHGMDNSGGLRSGNHQ
jgi:hypothetical protein